MSTPPRRPLPSPSPRPPVRRPSLPPVDPDDLVIARTALELGLPEVLVAGWLWHAGELRKPLARRRSPGAGLGGLD